MEATNGLGTVCSLRSGHRLHPCQAGAFLPQRKATAHLTCFLCVVLSFANGVI